MNREGGGGERSGDPVIGASGNRKGKTFTIAEVYANLGYLGMNWDEPGGEGAVLPSVFAVRLT